MNDIFSDFSAKRKISGGDYNISTINAVIKITFGCIFFCISRHEKN